MKVVRISTILPALLVHLTLACSVGTEVGNGVKPSDPSPPVTASNAASSAPASPDAATGDTNTSTTAAGQAPGVPISGSVAANAGGSAIVFNPAIDRMFANCASPFGSSSIVSPVVLSHKTTAGSTTSRDNKISATFSSGAQTWKISDANAALYRQLVLDQTHGAQAVIAYDAGFHALNNNFTCSTLATDTAATITGSTTVYTKLSVNLTDTTGHVFPLTWYLLPSGVVGVPMQLKRVEIGSSDSSAPLVLETE